MFGNGTESSVETGILCMVTTNQPSESRASTILNCPPPPLDKGEGMIIGQQYGKTKLKISR